MKSKILLSSLLLLTAYSYVMATNVRPPQKGPEGPGLGGAPYPIDTNEIVLIVAAVLLTVGVVMYKKLSVKKVA